MDEMVNISGKLTDFDGDPIYNGDVEVKDAIMTRYAYITKTDEYGNYSIKVKKGMYMAIAAVKDYRTKFLEYWGWHLPAVCDIEINMRIGGLEIYAINAFMIQRSRPYNTVMVYFRPMSLKRTIEFENNTEHGSETNYDVLALNLSKEDVEIRIDEQTANILAINKVTEKAVESPIQISGYLVQVSVPEMESQKEYIKIHITVADRETGERGEGCLFWAKPAAFDFICE